MFIVASVSVGGIVLVWGRCTFWGVLLHDGEKLAKNRIFDAFVVAWCSAKISRQGNLAGGHRGGYYREGRCIFLPEDSQ